MPSCPIDFTGTSIPAQNTGPIPEAREHRQYRVRHLFGVLEVQVSNYSSCSPHCLQNYGRNGAPTHGVPRRPSTIPWARNLRSGSVLSRAAAIYREALAYSGLLHLGPFAMCTYSRGLLNYQYDGPVFETWLASPLCVFTSTCTCKLVCTCAYVFSLTHIHIYILTVVLSFLLVLMFIRVYLYFNFCRALPHGSSRSRLVRPFGSPGRRKKRPTTRWRREALRIPGST